MRLNLHKPQPVPFQSLPFHAGLDSSITWIVNDGGQRIRQEADAGTYWDENGFIRRVGLAAYAIRLQEHATGECLAAGLFPV